MPVSVRVLGPPRRWNWLGAASARHCLAAQGCLPLVWEMIQRRTPEESSHRMLSQPRDTKSGKDPSRAVTRRGPSARSPHATNTPRRAEPGPGHAIKAQDTRPLGPASEQEEQREVGRAQTPAPQRGTGPNPQNR